MPCPRRVIWVSCLHLCVCVCAVITLLVFVLDICACNVVNFIVSEHAACTCTAKHTYTVVSTGTGPLVTHSARGVSHLCYPPRTNTLADKQWWKYQPLWHLNADESDNISSFFNFFGLTPSATTLAHLCMLSRVKVLCVTHHRPSY